MTLGAAYAELLDYLAGHELPKSVAKARDYIAARAAKHAEKQQKLKAARSCVCGRGNRVGLICNRCWKESPEHLFVTFREARGDEHRVAMRALYEWAKSQRPEGEQP